MADSLSKPGFGDASLAEKVIAAYSDGIDALTPEECASLSLDADQCAALQATLSKGKGGIVTDDERNNLTAAGFAREFIEKLAGNDGKNALNARVKWFAENFRPWSDKDSKISIINEMGDIGTESPKIIPMLAQEIDYGNPLKNEASAAIKKIGAAAVPQLAEMLSSDDYGAQYPAVRALDELGPDAAGALPELIVALKNTNISISCTAAGAIENIGAAAAEAVPALIEILNGPRSFCVQDAARQALGAIGPAAAMAVPAIVRYSVKVLGANAFEEHVMQSIGPDAVPWLIGLIHDPDMNIAEEAIRLIAEMGPSAKAASSELVKALSSTRDFDTLIRILQAIASIGPDAKEAIPKLTSYLDDKYPSMARRYAAIALGKMGAAAACAVDDLVDLLDDEDAGVRAAAAEALGDIGPSAEDAIDELIDTFRDQDYHVSYMTRLALGKIGPASIPPLVEVMEEEDDPNILLKASDALGRIGPPALPELGRLLQSGKVTVRVDSALALGVVGPEAVVLLIGALSDIDGDVRSNTAFSLGRIGKKARLSIPYLDRVREYDEDPECRKAAEKALKDIQKEIP